MSIKSVIRQNKSGAQPCLAVLGHLESLDLVRLGRIPRPGEITEAPRHMRQTAGCTAVAAAQMLKLGGRVVVFTRLGDDEHGRLAAHDLESTGVELEAARRAGAQRRGLAVIDDTGERTLVMLGPRHGPSGRDRLRWDRIAAADAAFFVSGDASAARAARQARVLVATARSVESVADARVAVDVLILSGNDAGERDAPGSLPVAPRHVVRTLGAEGGEWWRDSSRPRRWHAPAAHRIASADAYGAGDSFAGGLVYALAAGMDMAAAVDLAARCGASVAARPGPYAGQPTAQEVFA